MESRSRARQGDRGHLHHHRRQLLLLRPAAAAWSYVPGGGVSWPAQRSPSPSYTCGYCKRDFRSAQALGGHMNVHRRERARIRHYYCSAYPAAAAPAAVHMDSRVPNLNFSSPHCPGSDYAWRHIHGDSDGLQLLLYRGGGGGCVGGGPGAGGRRRRFGS